MIRLLVIFTGIAAVAVSAGWVADHPGSVEMRWGGYLVETSAAVLATAIAVLFAALLVVAWAWRRLREWLRFGHPLSAEGRRRRATQLLTRGMVALAAGDPGRARQLADRSRALTDDPALALLLAAQAAQAAGDDEAAAGHFRDLLDQPEAEFLGLRGLLLEATRGGETGRALELARRAEKLRPGTPWALTTIFEIEIHDGNWNEALATVSRAARSGVVPADQARRQKALVLHAQALATEKMEKTAGPEAARKAAFKMALRAHRLAPGLVPAAIAAARLGAGTNPRKAAGIIRQTWAVAPHPELARLFAALYPGEKPARHVARLGRLAGANPDHPESHLAVAEAAVNAGLWAEAGTHLEALESSGHDLDARYCGLMARYEAGANASPSSAALWRERAGEAATAAWNCQSCGREAEDWSLHCAACEALDSLVWSRPVAATVSPPAAHGVSPQDAESAARAAV